MFAWSGKLRENLLGHRHRNSKATRKSGAGHRRCRTAVLSVLERLEDRTLLAVTFTPTSPVVPARNVDIPLGGGTGSPTALTSCCPIEPWVSINPQNPAEIAASSQQNLAVSRDVGASYLSAPPASSVLSFPGGSGGDTGTVYDSQGNLFW